MADTTELYAARWAANLPVSGGPNSNDLEAVVKLILGIPFATVITRGLGLNEVSQFETEEIWMRGATPGTVGLRMQDTGGEDFLVFTQDTHLKIYHNTGTEGTPVWTLKGFVPISLICHYIRDLSYTITDSGVTIPWVSVDREEESTMWNVANASRMVAPFDGWYGAKAGIYENVGGQSVSSYLMYMCLEKNGSTLYGTARNQFMTHSGAEPGFGMDTWWEGEMTAGDYLELYMWTNDPSDLGVATFRAALELKRLL